jgi:hypothetical protein
MKEHYVYCVTNTLNNKKYIGSHSGYINDDYLGSGVILKKAIKKYGKRNFVKDILWDGPIEYMRDMETYWCEYFDVANNDLFYNRTNKGTGYVYGKPNPKLSEVRKAMNVKVWNKGLRKETSEAIQKQSEKQTGKSSGMKGKLAWNAGKIGTMLGKKHTPEAYANLFWERKKVECEFCNKLIGINNIKVHKRKKHNLLT